MSHDATPTTDADDEQSLEVVRPDADLDADTEIEESPVEKAKSALSEDLKRDFVAASDDHPLVQTAGSRGALQSGANAALIKELSDGIYSDDDVYWREWAQNHIAAVVREGKRRVKNEYGRDALYRDIHHDHPSLDAPRTVRLPKSSAEILEMARDLGYTPSIKFTIDHDDGSIRSRDNGIGMTTGEVIDVWNEPAESGSRKDLSSAGTKGLGALTWISVSGDEGGAAVITRTRRRETLNGQHVPQRDRDGFGFFSYLGGVLPTNADIPDGFYGTQFKIPIKSSLDANGFMGKMAKYTDVLPVTISWHEVKGGERVVEDEFEATEFFDRYDEDPAIQIDRPGEFRLALDTPDIVPKGRSVEDTFLLDNPIQRNTPYRHRVDTLWNDHLQLLNEQALIIAGPNRGKRRDQVEDLAGSKADIKDDDAPMPDVPLPEPTTSRDQLQQGEAAERFITYVDHLATARELERVDDYITGLLDCDDAEAALEFVLDRGTEYMLFKKLLGHHNHHKALRNTKALMRWLDDRDTINFTLDGLPTVTDDSDVPDLSAHEHYAKLDFLTSLQNDVDAFKSRNTRRDPDKKDNRKSLTLAELLIEHKQYPVFVGAKLNHDRVRVILNDENHPNAAIIKDRNYSWWKSSPLDVTLVKNVPFTQPAAEEADGDWLVSDTVHARHKKTAGGSGPGGVDVSANALRVRTTENQAVDVRIDLGDFREQTEAADFGRPYRLQNPDSGESASANPWTVVFPPSGENISDHYHLSEHANLINASAEEAHALLEHQSVFRLADFQAFLEDTRLPFYAPLSGTGGTGRITTLTDWAREDGNRLVLAVEGNDLHTAAVYDHDHSRLPDDPQRQAIVRDAIFQKLWKKFGMQNPLRDDDYDDVDTVEWRAIRWGELTDLERTRALTYWAITLDTSSRGNLDKSVLRWLGTSGHNTYPGDVRAWHATGLKKTVKRSQYPGWANDSDAWNRMGSYRQTGYEAALMRAARDLGIDPTTHDTDHLQQAIVMLATTCPGGDN